MMTSSLTTIISLAQQQYRVHTECGYSLAIPLKFAQCEQQPNHFGAQPAQASAMQAGGFIGDTKQGGSCNVKELTLNPHCNGTHTETIAHICHASDKYGDKESDQLVRTIADICLPPLLPCHLISLTPVLANTTTDSYSPAFHDHDRIISKQLLTEALHDSPDDQLHCLVIRTLPNSDEKCRARYSDDNQPPFLSRQAILYLNERGVEHLVLDIPSLDRLNDDGLLTCHHLFWQVPERSHQLSTDSLVGKTITEMAYISEEVADGFYFINMQMPAFVSDAAPSKPVLYQCQLISESNINKAAKA